MKMQNEYLVAFLLGLFYSIQGADGQACFNQPCLRDNDCRFQDGLTCRGTCTCKPGYTLRYPNTGVGHPWFWCELFLRQPSSLRGPCEVDSDCRREDNLRCGYTKTCECQPGFIETFPQPHIGHPSFFCFRPVASYGYGYPTFPNPNLNTNWGLGSNSYIIMKN